MEMLRRELNVEIEDIDAKSDLRDALDSYRSLLYDYRGKRGHYLFVTNWVKGYHGH